LPIKLLATRETEPLKYKEGYGYVSDITLPEKNVQTSFQAIVKNTYVVSPKEKANVPQYYLGCPKFHFTCPALEFFKGNFKAGSQI